MQMCTLGKINKGDVYLEDVSSWSVSVYHVYLAIALKAEGKRLFFRFFYLVRSRISLKMVL